MPRKYLIQKYHEPETPERLRPLARPDAYSLLASEPGRVVEERLLEPWEVDEVARRPHIKAVEPDHAVSTPAPVRIAAAEHITSARAEQLVGIDKLKAHGLTGEGVTIAIYDTGLHRTLYERYRDSVVELLNFTSDPDAFDPTSKHGSWIFSVLRHALPKAKFIIVKVLSTEDGSGTYSGVIKGVQATLGKAHGGNASLGGPRSQIVNDAFDDADRRGIVMGVAAGNEQRGRTDYVANNTSPASAERTMTVAAKQSDLVNASFSNWGNCVRIASPGVYIECPDADVIPGHWSGTSMSVYAFAVAALLRGAGHAPEDVKQAVYSSAVDLVEPAYKEGHGLADGAAALEKLNPPVLPPEPEPVPEPEPAPEPEPEPTPEPDPPAPKPKPPKPKPQPPRKRPWWWRWLFGGGE